jgi:hypothetical protein
VALQLRTLLEAAQSLDQSPMVSRDIAPRFDP